MTWVRCLLLLLLACPALACDPELVRSSATASSEQLEGLVQCLASPDPELRDEFAYTTLAELLREQRPADRQLAFLYERLLQLLRAPDPDGVARPFAILTLAEIARTDRISAWMDSAQRQQLVDTAGNFLDGLSDYRGFDPQVGWRHGVAHAADLAMQLALNPAVDADQLWQLLQAIAAQVGPAEAYRFGEPARLARPVLFIAAREVIGPQAWQDWFVKLADPKPLPDWEAAWHDADGLARRHNLRAFALEIYLNATQSEQPGIRALEPRALALLEAID